jgi:hypothetical protein
MTSKKEKMCKPRNTLVCRESRIGRVCREAESDESKSNPQAENNRRGRCVNDAISWGSFRTEYVAFSTVPDYIGEKMKLPHGKEVR